MIRNMKNLKQISIAFGTLYSLKVLWSLFKGFKTFILPSFWPRNFPREYGEWAIITGCTRGVGLCYANELAKRNMNLILVGRDLDKLEKLANLIQSKYQVHVELIKVDFSSHSDFSEEIKQVIKDKDIGILVNNVGVILPHPMYFHEMNDEQLEQMVDVNIKATTKMTQLILPKLEAKKKGAIVNLASVSGLSPQPLQSVYAASKAFIDFFSRGLQVEYQNSKITIQTLCPSYICTSMTSFSSSLSKPSLFVPDPQTFAANAIQTLGFSSYTTGYWPHSLQILFPVAFMPNIIYRMNKRFRYESSGSTGQKAR